MTEFTHTPNHERIRRVLTSAESVASNLDKYQDVLLDPELKQRLRNAQATIRLLSKSLVYEVDAERSLDGRFEDLVPDYLNRTI